MHQDERNPVIVSFGGGVDSTAVLVEMVRRGMRIDRVLFADTGGEKPETYAHVAYMSDWLAERGYPEVTVVRYRPARATYHTLEQKCLTNETLPSISFGRRSCSIVFKHEQMDQWVMGVARGPNRRDPSPEWIEAQAAGGRITRVIGYDAGEVARGRGRDKRTGRVIESDENFDYSYPLVEWGWDRERCIGEIVKAGARIPIKSACWYCGASKEWELFWLAGRHPNLFIRAIEMEDNARNGKHGLTKVGGLGGYAGPKQCRSWRAWAESEDVIAPGTTTIVASTESLLVRAAELKPEKEANVMKPCMEVRDKVEGVLGECAL